MAHSTDPFSASIANILELLTEEFKAGREYDWQYFNTFANSRFCSG